MDELVIIYNCIFLFYECIYMLLQILAQVVAVAVPD